MGDASAALATKKQKALPKKGSEVRWKFPLGTFDAEHLYAAFEEEPAEGVVSGFYHPPELPEVVDDKKSKSPPGPTSPVWLRVAFVLVVEEDDGTTVENQVTAKVHPDWLC